MSLETEAEVIDDDLIMSALGSSEKHSASNATLAEIVAEITSLSLSFKNVQEIANLQGFCGLQKLCVDKNAPSQDLITTRFARLASLDSLRSNT